MSCTNVRLPIFKWFRVSLSLSRSRSLLDNCFDRFFSVLWNTFAMSAMWVAGASSRCVVSCSENCSPVMLVEPHRSWHILQGKRKHWPERWDVVIISRLSVSRFNDAQLKWYCWRELSQPNSCAPFHLESLLIYILCDLSYLSCCIQPLGCSHHLRQAR